MRYFTIYFQRFLLQSARNRLKLYAVVLTAVSGFSIASAQQSQMRKGPYLIYPNDPGRMTVLWQLKNSDTCRIRWGSTPACDSGSALTTETGQNIDEHQHIHTLSELTPNRLYYYQVIENNVTHPGSFRSAPPDTADSTSFFVYGDTRSIPQWHDSVLSGICSNISNAPSRQTILLHSGDWNASDYEWNWDQEYFNRSCTGTLEALSKIPVNGVIGNHEMEGDRTVFKKYWPYPYESGGYYYAFDYGPVHISVIDQYTSCSPGSEQLQWLENDLAYSDKTWKFILLHEPGYSAGHHLNNFHVQTIIQPLCRKYGVKGVFSGHNHYYAHCMIDEVHHLTLGGGGAPLYQVGNLGEGLIKSETTLHYAHITIRPDSAVVTAIRPDGTVIEKFLIRERPEPPPPPPPPPNRSKKETGLLTISTIRSMKLLVVELERINYKYATLTLLNIAGTMLLTRKLETSRTVVDLASYPKGIYFARITPWKSAAPVKILLY
ncbi:MAG: metallophosphoesterase family protein [Chitinispirillaceae bacterium]|nr:metallophosphoesterase family protein [Chitinispirillaceae bacterium]